MKKTIVPILLAGLWITFSEFVRNEFLFKSLWVSHFNGLGLTFQTLPLNGILWMIWSFTLSFVLFKLLQKFVVKETLLYSWIIAFCMMWITIYNLQVFPLQLLIGAIPLSILELYVAILILQKASK